MAAFYGVETPSVARREPSEELQTRPIVSELCQNHRMLHGAIGTKRRRKSRRKPGMLPNAAG